MKRARKRVVATMVVVAAAAPASSTACYNEALAAAREALPRNSSAAASAMLSACRSAGVPLSAELAKAYFANVWLPEEPSGCAATTTTRFGPPGEGGKVLCDASSRRRGLGHHACLIVSVGLNDDTRAEQAMHASYPHCTIEGWDGTLSPAKRRLLPPRSAMEYIPHNLNATSYKRYEGRVVSLLKIDCEGCELSLLASWLDRVCTEQIAIEVHGCSRVRHSVGPASSRLPKAHAMMMRLDKEFRIFHREPNPRFPDGCLEYSLQRRWPCDRRAGRNGA